MEESQNGFVFSLNSGEEAVIKSEGYSVSVRSTGGGLEVCVYEEGGPVCEPGISFFVPNEQGGRTCEESP